MNQHKSGSVVVGVDVGGLKKGFHAVTLQDGQYREKFSTLSATELAAWCRRLEASVVGIDAPCRWSLTGRARPCERALAAEGLHTFATPSQAKGRGEENGDILNFLAGGDPALWLSSSSRRSDPETSQLGKSRMSRFYLRLTFKSY